MCRPSDYPPYREEPRLVSVYGKVAHRLARRDGYIVSATHVSDQFVADVVIDEDLLVRAWRFRAENDDQPLPTFVAHATVYITSHVDDDGASWRVLDLNRAAGMLDPLHGKWNTEDALLLSLAEQYIDRLASARDARAESARRSQ